MRVLSPPCESRWVAIVLLIGCHNSNPGSPPDAPGGSDAAIAIDAAPIPDAAPSVDHLKQIFDEVDGARITQTLRELAGDVPVVVNGATITLGERFDDVGPQELPRLLYPDDAGPRPRDQSDAVPGDQPPAARRQRRGDPARAVARFADHHRPLRQHRPEGDGDRQPRRRRRHVRDVDHAGDRAAVRRAQGPARAHRAVRRQRRGGARRSRGCAQLRHVHHGAGADPGLQADRRDRRRAERVELQRRQPLRRQPVPRGSTSTAAAATARAASTTGSSATSCPTSSRPTRRSRSSAAASPPTAITSRSPRSACPRSRTRSTTRSRTRTSIRKAATPSTRSTSTT